MAIDGTIDWTPPCPAYTRPRVPDRDADLEPDDEDARGDPQGRRLSTSASSGTTTCRAPLDRTVIYETHHGHDEAFPACRPSAGHDAGLASDVVIGYLTDWGHAVELDDHTSPTVLPPRRGDEYWGTDDRLLRSHAQRRQREPRELKELRADQGARAGIEVFLDVATTHRGAATSGRCSRSRCRQRELHRSTPTTQPLLGLHGHGHHAQRRHPASTALDSLRYFVSSPRRRFRFDLAGPGPPVLDVGGRSRRSSHDPPGPVLRRSS